MMMNLDVIRIRHHHCSSILVKWIDVHSVVAFDMVRKLEPIRQDTIVPIFPPQTNSSNIAENEVGKKR